MSSVLFASTVRVPDLLLQLIRSFVIIPDLCCPDNSSLLKFALWENSFFSAVNYPYFDCSLNFQYFTFWYGIRL